MTTIPGPNYIEQLIEQFTQGFLGLAPDFIDEAMPEGILGNWFGREQKSAEPLEMESPAAQTFPETASIERWFATYHNGDIPLSAMTEIPGGGYLRPDAGSSFIDMYNAALRDGVTLTVGPGGAAYRSLAIQESLAASKGIYGQGGWAAVPGTSKHGWGIAFDVSGQAAINWLNKHGGEYGWNSGANWSRPEPWHWEFDGSYTSAGFDELDKPRRERRARPQFDQGAAGMVAPQAMRMPQAMWSAFFETYKDQAAGGKVPAYVKKGDTQPGGGVKRQLWQGFMDAGREDLAKMVYTKDFQTWINAESGWRVNCVSRSYIVNGTAGVNGGLFQVRYPAHPWAHQYFSDGNTPASTFTASAYEQAMMIAQHFPGLTPEKIRTYAQQVRSGGYHGWP